MANLNYFYISSFKQTKFVSLRTMPFLLIDICHSPGFADGWSTISDTFCYCWIADRHFWNFSAKVWSRTGWESNLIVQTDARLAVAWPRAIFWIWGAFLSCFIGFLVDDTIDNRSSFQLCNIFLSSPSEVGSGIRIALRWEIWSEKGDLWPRNEKPGPLYDDMWLLSGNLISRRTSISCRARTDI